MLITHDWNGSAITQLVEVTKIAKHDVPSGYVNVTQMCKACDKQFNDYSRLESTKEYLEGFSRYTGIPVDLLIVTITTGKNQFRGTWTHPEIAIDCAKWVSVEFRIWANYTLRQVISGQAIEITEVPVPQLPTPTPSEISEVLGLIFQGTDLNPNLIAGVKANAIAKYHPTLAMLVETAKSSLSISVESELVRPTKLGEMLSETTGEKWSAVRVNKMLVEQGFQIKNPDGKNPSYLPTEKGKEYGQLVLDTAKGRDKTVQSLQWHPTVMIAMQSA
jgi:KilA-N domain